MRGKSKRGNGSTHPRRTRGVKADRIILTADMTAATALQVIAQSCLRQIRLNETTLAASDNAEALHQARIGLRRLRSALVLLRPMLADDRYERLRAELKWMAVTLGQTRNIDVLIAHFRHEPVPKASRAARRTAYAQVRAALATPRWRALMRDMTEWLTAGAWLTKPEGSSLRDEPIARCAASILDRTWKRLKRRGRNLSDLDDHARHRVRIAAKKLRYAAEFFARLYTGKTAERRRRAFGKAIEKLQDGLGELNDLATVPALLTRLGVAKAPPLSRDRKRLLAKAERSYRALFDVKRFWR